MPETSIVIRTFNEVKHIGNLLEGIQNQQYKNFEIVIVDSGSTDGTLEIAQKYPVRIIKIESRDFTFGYALNVGCEASQGNYLVFVSGHVIPTHDLWLTNLIKPFQNERRAMVYGKQVGNERSKFSERIDFKRLFGTRPINSKKLLTYANNANSAIRKSLWEETKFDEHLFGLEDIDWARKVIEKGYRVYYEPTAPVYHIHEERWYQVFNRYRREAIAAVRIGLPHPPQSRLSIFWLLYRVALDFIYSFPNYTDRRIEEMLRFRYYQWKGSRLGWKQGRDIDFEIEKNNYFYPTENFAVVISEREKAELVEVAQPTIRPGDILIKVDYVGVCRTDIEVYEGTLGYYRDGVAQYPIIPGHEFSGTIAKIGSNNTFQERFKVGEKVVGECILSRGEDGVRKEVGVINMNGAYGKYVIVPGDAVHHVPPEVDQKCAVLAEPLAVVLRALRRVAPRLTHESRIAVVGAGQIGNLITQVLAFRGHNVVVFDTDEARLALLKTSTHATHTSFEGIDAYDVIIEATGLLPVCEKIIHESNIDSTLLLLGFPYGEMQYNFEDIVGKEKFIIGSVGADEEDFSHALKLLPKLDMKPFTEVVMPLEEFRKAWEVHKTRKHIKILLQP
jgi:2-desacetyl-2-hydroxyethyl bacteriochlorophyllide A dehydrogenase